MPSTTFVNTLKTPYHALVDNVSFSTAAASPVYDGHDRER